MICTFQLFSKSIEYCIWVRKRRVFQHSPHSLKIFAPVTLGKNLVNTFKIKLQNWETLRKKKKKKLAKQKCPVNLVKQGHWLHLILFVLVLFLNMCRAFASTDTGSTHTHTHEANSGVKHFNVHLQNRKKRRRNSKKQPAGSEAPGKASRWWCGSAAGTQRGPMRWVWARQT